jgi:hypothetical protein
MVFFMARFSAALVFLLAIPSFGATYYVSNSGNDSNAGTSTLVPWATVGRVNTFLAATGISGPQPGDSILFQRGGVWRDAFIQCQNIVAAATGWTTASNPPACSGSASAPITIGAYGTGANPIIDGADPLTLTWTPVNGSTWQATLSSGTMPSKLYVDGTTSETAQLIPVPNATGAYSSSTTYNSYDGVTSSGIYYVRGPIAPSSGNVLSDPSTWIPVTNSNSGNTSQTFSSTNSGLANVEAIPGSWYGTGTTIYVNLGAGSNPNSHSFEGTRRPYGVELLGVNYVTVTGLTVEHTQQSCFAAIDYPNDNGTYFTGEYLQFTGNQAWNCGGIVTDHSTMQSHMNHLQADYLVRTNGQYNPHLLRGDLISGNYAGQLDSYFAELSNIYQGAIIASGIDGGGVSNNPVIYQNSVAAVNTRAIVYYAGDLYASTGQIIRNNGGTVGYNNVTNSQGNIFFSSTEGGLDTHNQVEFSYGQGVQAGGESTSTTAQPQVHSFNVLAHLGKGANAQSFNGFDCNTNGANFSDGYWLNNTVYDVNSAAITFEATGGYGCINAHVHNNIFDQDALRFPTYDETNPSYLMYWVVGYGNEDPDFSNNWWIIGSNPVSYFGHSVEYKSCAAFAAAWPDQNAICGGDPQFVDAAAGDFRLEPSSAGIKAGTNGTYVGALPQTN